MKELTMNEVHAVSGGVNAREADELLMMALGLAGVIVAGFGATMYMLYSASAQQEMSFDANYNDPRILDQAN